MVHLGLIILLLIVFAISKAVMDTLSFHYSSSIFKDYDPQWWCPQLSWANKYKNGDEKQGPKFFGSTTFFVFVTDAWHLSQFIFLSAIQLALIIGLDLHFDFAWYWFPVLFIGLKTFNGQLFELFYKKLFIKKGA